MYAASALTFAVALAACAGSPVPQDRLGLRDPVAEQDFFRGLQLHYAVYPDQAVAAFEQAAAADRRSALPRWGIALALGPLIDAPDMSESMRRGFTEARAAVDLSGSDTDLARDLVAALAVRYTDSPTFDSTGLNRAYADAMASVAARYADDDDVATLYAESLMLSQNGPWWSPDGAPAAPIARAISVLDRVLARRPSHLGANHYYVRVMEGAAMPQLALASARRLETLAPDDSHLLHMASHVYTRMGDYLATVAANQKAIAAEQRQAGGVPRSGAAGVLAAHAREYLAMAAAMTGQIDIARQADSGPFPLLRFNRWDDVLARQVPSGEMGAVEWRAARVLALAGSRRLADAENERRALDVAVRRLAPDAKWHDVAARTVIPLVTADIDARLAWAHGDRSGAIARWREAVAAQDALAGADALRCWFHPVRESLGMALFSTRQFKEAESVFRDDLARTKRNPRSLYGLWRTLEAQGRGGESGPERDAFMAAWAHANAPLRMEDL